MVRNKTHASACTDSAMLTKGVQLNLAQAPTTDACAHGLRSWQQRRHLARHPPLQQCLSIAMAQKGV